MPLGASAGYEIDGPWEILLWQCHAWVFECWAKRLLVLVKKMKKVECRTQREPTREAMNGIRRGEKINPGVGLGGSGIGGGINPGGINPGAGFGAW